jgi:hypothetical protein
VPLAGLASVSIGAAAIARHNITRFEYASACRALQARHLMSWGDDAAHGSHAGDHPMPLQTRYATRTAPAWQALAQTLHHATCLWGGTGVQAGVAARAAWRRGWAPADTIAPWHLHATHGSDASSSLHQATYESFDAFKLVMRHSHQRQPRRWPAAGTTVQISKRTAAGVDVPSRAKRHVIILWNYDYIHSSGVTVGAGCAAYQSKIERVVYMRTRLQLIRCFSYSARQGPHGFGLHCSTRFSSPSCPCAAIFCIDMRARSE